MPDLTPKPLRSKANAVINLMGALGGIFTLVMISVLVPKTGRPDYMPLFLSVAAVMVVAVVALLLTIRENRMAPGGRRGLARAGGGAGQDRRKEKAAPSGAAQPVVFAGVRVFVVYRL